MKYPYFILLCLGMLLFSMCDDDEQGGDTQCFDPRYPWCENYDSCWGRWEPVSAEFSTGFVTTFSGENTFYPVDSFHVSTYIWFKAEDSTAQYEWQVGTDPRTFTDSVFSLGFPPALEGHNLEIELSVERLQDSFCVGKEALVDEQAKEIVFVPSDWFAFEGTYSGHLDSFPDEEYEIDIEVEQISSTIYHVHIDNLFNQGCEYVFEFVGGYNFTRLSVNLEPVKKEDCTDFTLVGSDEIIIGEGMLHLDLQIREMFIGFNVYTMVNDKYNISYHQFFGAKK